MTDAATIVLTALLVGTAGGIFASVVGFLTTASAHFSGRKFAIALMTGAIAGLTVGVAQANSPVFIVGQLSDQLITLATIFLEAVGIDFVRNRIGDAQRLASDTSG